MENKKELSVQQLIQEKKKKGSYHAFVEKIMPYVLLTVAIISVLTTVGIVLTLIVETMMFFTKVSIVEYLTSKTWYPFSESQGSYGILPLIVGTLKVSIIATIFAVPIGMGAAIYLSEYASDKARRGIKPILEVLAGIPTIVYGFFALTFVTPLLQKLIPSLEMFNALSPGLVIGVMITPMIASLTEDALTSVPRSLREGAFALGSTKLEVATKVVVPAASSGIISSIVLAISRAIGETMIVAVAGGSTPTTSLDITHSIQTMTAYIVQVSQGDAGYQSTIYYSIYAVGFTLLLFTFAMNILAFYVRKRFKEDY